MILYHGTNTDFDKIDLSHSLRLKDFGKGFYLTDIQSQAFEMAQRKVRIDGGVPIVQKYDFDQESLTDGTLSVAPSQTMASLTCSICTRTACGRWTSSRASCGTNV